MTGFVKLYSTILTSSIWLESDSTLRVWIAMLSTADENGYVGASIGGLAHVSRVSREDCVAALETFLAPDPDSRTEDNDGRRIEKVEGGWLILNHRKYRDMRTQKQIDGARRVAEHRERQALQSVTGNDVTPEAEGEGEAKAETEKDSSTTAREPSLDDVLDRLGIWDGRPRWYSLLDGMTQGLGTPGMKAVSVNALLEAAAELAAVGGDVTPHRYKTFVAKVMERNGKRSSKEGKQGRSGAMTKAIDIISRLRALNDVRNTYTGDTTLRPEWRQSFSDAEYAVLMKFGVRRILTDQNESALVSQLARVVEEAGL